MMSFVWGAIGIIVFIVVAPAMQWMARRAARPLSPTIVLAIAAVLSHVTSIILGAMTVPQFQYWNAASIFSFGVMSYVFAFGAVYKSVSLEILLDIAERPGRESSLVEVVEHRIPDVFLGRTKILVESGLAEYIGPTFAPTAAGRKLAGRITRLRRLFAIGDTGLYDFSD